MYVKNIIYCLAVFSIVFILVAKITFNTQIVDVLTLL